MAGNSFCLLPSNAHTVPGFYCLCRFTGAARPSAAGQQHCPSGTFLARGTTPQKMGLTTHSRERRVLAVLVLLVFARLAGTAAAAAGAADSYYTTDHSLDDGSQVSQMNPPVILDDDPATPVTYVWPETEGTPWPLSDYNEDAELLVEADYEGACGGGVGRGRGVAEAVGKPC